MADMNRFILSPAQRKIVEQIRRDNFHKVLTVKLGKRAINLNAAALVQDLENIINRSREIRGIA